MSKLTYEDKINIYNARKNRKTRSYLSPILNGYNGEVNTLNWNDIDFEQRTVSINKNINLKIKGEKYTIIPVKTKGINQVLPLSQKLLNDLILLKNYYSKFSNFNQNWFVFGEYSHFKTLQLLDKLN